MFDYDRRRGGTAIAAASRWSVRNKARQPGGKGEIRQRDLVKNALRMRPDRIIIGECRGEEAFDMLQAMNTGHEGSMTTIHANTPRDALKRLEQMVAMGGVSMNSEAIRSQIASSINLIVQLQRLADGKRRVTSICEITGMEGDVIQLFEIYQFVKDRSRRKRHSWHFSRDRRAAHLPSAVEGVRD